MLASGASAEGPVKERVFGNPPVLGQPSAATGAASLLRLPAPGPRVSNERSYNLDIKYVESRLFDPSTGHDQKVRLRGYVGTDTDPNRPYIAPTIEVAPGDTVRVTLNNKLPVDPTLHRTRVRRPILRIASTAPTCTPMACGSARPATATTCC